MMFLGIRAGHNAQAIYTDSLEEKQSFVIFLSQILAHSESNLILSFTTIKIKRLGIVIKLLELSQPARLGHSVKLRNFCKFSGKKRALRAFILLYP